MTDDDFDDGFQRLSTVAFGYGEPLITEGEMHEISEVVRLYVLRNESSAHFVAVEWARGDGWNGPNVWVEKLAHGWAAFDGVRHLYVGEEGYLHCPRLKDLATVLLKLEELLPDRS